MIPQTSIIISINDTPGCVCTERERERQRVRAGEGREVEV